MTFLNQDVRDWLINQVKKGEYTREGQMLRFEMNQRYTFEIKLDGNLGKLEEARTYYLDNNWLVGGNNWRPFPSSYVLKQHKSDELFNLLSEVYDKINAIKVQENKNASMRLADQFSEMFFGRK